MLWSLMWFSLLAVAKSDDQKHLFEGQAVEELFEKLFHGYNSHLRPICTSASVNSTSPTNSVTRVEFGASLRQIVDMDEKAQILTTLFWVHMRWRDCRLSWDNNSFEGISSITVPCHNLWTPDVTLYDSVSLEGGSYFHLETKQSWARVSSDGLVYVTVPALLKSSCLIQVTDFPFDQQNCSLKFGPWIYHGFEVKLVYSHITAKEELRFYTSSGEFTLVLYYLQLHELQYVCCPETYTDITVYMIMERRPLYYLFNFGFPVTLLMLLVTMNCLIPVESGEKISLGITVLLSLSVFLLVVSDMMPATSESLPLIGMCFGIVMVLVGLNSIAAIVVVNLYYRDESEQMPPRWLWILSIRIVARIICRRIPTNKLVNYERYYAAMGSTIVRRRSTRNRSYSLDSLELSLLKVAASSHNVEAPDSGAPFAPVSSAAATNFLWKEISRILDRFFSRLIFLLFLTILLTISVMISMEDDSRHLDTGEVGYRWSIS